MGFVSLENIIQGNGDEKAVPVYSDGQSLKVWDNAKYGRIVDRFEEGGTKYVHVMFDHPDNPPSNNTVYLYLAPENNG